MSFYLKKYMWLISLFAVILCSYFLAKITANLIAVQFEGKWVPVAPISSGGLRMEEGEVKGRDAYEPIVERNIFNSSATTAEAPPLEGDTTEPVGETVPEGEAVATSLKIKLVSTFSVGDGADERSSCVIVPEGGKGQQEVYTVNDEKQFSPETKIVKILYNRVEFVHKSRLEYVELEDFASGVAINVPPTDSPVPSSSERTGGEETPGVEKTPEGSFAIDRAEIDEALGNLDKLYTQIRAVPYFKEGRSNGLKLLSVRSGSLFSKLGLRRGDILQKINGMELDIKRGLEIFNQLKNETKISIELERRGSPQTLEYEIR